MAQLARRLCCARQRQGWVGVQAASRQDLYNSGRGHVTAQAGAAMQLPARAGGPRQHGLGRRVDTVRSPLASPAQAPGPGSLWRRCTPGPAARASASCHSTRVKCCGPQLCCQPPLRSADAACYIVTMPDGHAPAGCMSNHADVPGAKWPLKWCSQA